MALLFLNKVETPALMDEFLDRHEDYLLFGVIRPFGLISINTHLWLLPKVVIWS